MDYPLLNDAFAQILHLLVWSCALLVIIQGFLKLSPNLQYWSALWKVALLLCLMPLVPWSHITWPLAELPFANTFLPQLPEVWADIGVLADEPAHEMEVNAGLTALHLLMGLTALSVMGVSLFKVAYFVFKLVRFNRNVKRLAILEETDTASDFLTQQQGRFLAKHRIQLMKSEESTSPFATGLLSPKIILPRSFFVLPLAQQRLLVEHEITHIKRLDLFWLILFQLAKCLFWFAPAIHLFKSKLDLAIEVECDRQVLKTFPHMNKEYGSALINVVKQTQQKINPQAVFFINQQFADLKRRITFTQTPVFEHGKSAMNKLTLTAIAITFSATSWALNTNIQNLMTAEEFVKQHRHASRYIDDQDKDVKLHGNWVNPVKTAWVSSHFKAKEKLRYFRPHLGIDLAAKQGEHIVAASDGVVIIADDSSLNKNHGNVVVIDHGENTLSMYSHMDSFDIKKGDTVKAGQRIGKVGVTGKTTGPHLHFEIIQADRHVDPARVISFN